MALLITDKLGESGDAKTTDVAQCEIMAVKGLPGMMSQDSLYQDIFKGSEKVEILGKLPSLLWAYSEASRKYVQELTSKPNDQPESLDRVQKLLGILDSAADHLGNEDLKNRLAQHIKIIAQIQAGHLRAEEFETAFLPEVTKMEQLAGPRRDSSPDALLEKAMLDRELDKAERIKTGRSADIVVSVDILEDVRNYLSQEVMTEGISSVLVIDSAGSLICNVGHKIDLDVVSLAAVAAANFAATEQIARLIGETDFVLLFYKGHNESFHFLRVGAEYIIVTIFNNQLSLGLLRLKIAEVAQVLEKKLPKREV
ncbi:MAG: roadblock/LC7 domain-containing protein [Desulfomonile tiedjei]|uniref:Roadblock/LC7 domain-containing protein n=1 Tax=Desulfomonile tiedjei TaxID=2358 RepID=A0A9D6V2U8_9BACT|nr:roadblock/LC7 domain-containing protein [Desulfomonile tiedjei]